MNRMRVQPANIEIPDQNPFANDQLDRQEPVETLTSILQRVDSPCILGIDAPWGSGKTTFLDMWDKYLRRRGFATGLVISTVDKLWEERSL